MLQCNSLLTMLLHVFASPVYASLIHVRARRTNFLHISSNNLCCSRIPRHIQFSVQRTAHTNKDDCQTVVCAENFMGNHVPTYKSLQYPFSIIIISCLFYHLLPVLRLFPESRITPPQAFGYWQSAWETWNQCLCLQQYFVSELGKPLLVCLHQVN